MGKGKMKVQITKCYLVQIVDEEGNELKCEYVFGDKEDAKKVGRELKEDCKKNNLLQ